jgi:hypothetical protein
MPTFDSGRRNALRAAVALAACASAGLRAADVLGAATTSGDNVFSLGNFALEAGTILPDARIAFKTHGRLDADGSNAILYPTQFAAQHGDIEWIIGPGRALDPDKYFVIVADQLGNGLSSSPSNTAAPFDRMRFPTVTIRDDVAAQYRLVTEENPTDYSIESLRRTKALHILKGTGDLQTVRALLGHVQIESTARYLGLKTKADPIAVCRAFDI